MKISDQASERIQRKLDSLSSKNRTSIKNSESGDCVKKLRRNEKILSNLEEKIKILYPTVQELRNYCSSITDQTKFAASYLLIGKSFIEIKAICILLKCGFPHQVLQLVRSSLESLQLSNLFLDDKNQNKLQKWFSGSIINNNASRVSLSAAIQSMFSATGKPSLPIGTALTDVYTFYSGYTHSGYEGLLELISTTTADIDFECQTELASSLVRIKTIEQLYVELLLGLKNFFICANDHQNLKKIQLLLAHEYYSFASPQEISGVFQRYIPSVGKK